MILALVALLFTGLLGAAGLAVDVGHGYLVRAILQHAVDDGVRSGVRWSAQAQDTAGDGGAIITGAVAAAQSVTRADLAAQGLGRAQVTAGLSNGHLTVSAEASAPTFFLPVLGLTHWTVRASADGWFIPAAGTSVPAVIPMPAPAAIAPSGLLAGAVPVPIQQIFPLPGSAAAFVADLTVSLSGPASLVPEPSQDTPGSPSERTPEPPSSGESPSPDPPGGDPCDCGGGAGGEIAEGG